jgi:hypothetical protein
MFIFHRLKINHDSHEFILESGVIANNWEDVWFDITFNSSKYLLDSTFNYIYEVFITWKWLAQEEKTTMACCFPGAKKITSTKANLSF